MFKHNFNCDNMIFILLLYLFYFLFNQDLITNIILDATKIWYFNLLPILFPSFILADLLINNKLFNNILNKAYRYFNKILSINYPISLLIIIISYIFGSPLSTKIINDSYNNNKLSLSEANNLCIVYSHLSLPFVIAIANIFNFNIYKYLIITIILDFILFKILNKKENNINIAITNNTEKTINIFLKSINKNILIILSILGIIISFRIIAIILPSNIYPIIEILGGIYSINTTSIPYIIFLISFMGLSVHMQIYFCFNYIKYYKFLLIRITYSILLFILFII